jgi:chloride channel 3/4/5
MRDQLVYGYIARSDLEVLLDQNFSTVHGNEEMPIHFSHDPPPFSQPSFLDFSSHVDKYPIKILPYTPIDRVLQLFQGLGLRYLLITSHRGQLTGIVKKKDMLLAIRVDSGEMRRLGS